MADRIGVPWVERFGLVLLIGWFVVLMSLGTYVALYPIFERYLQHLREGHQVQALHQDIRRWQERLTVALADAGTMPGLPEPMTLTDWLAGFPDTVQVIEVDVLPRAITLSVEGRPDQLWAWLETALPSWGGLTATELQLRGTGMTAQLQLTLLRAPELRVWPRLSGIPVILPTWGPLSQCPTLALVSRIGRAVRLKNMAGVEQGLVISEWLDADWQLIHVSGRTLQWRSRLGTLCQAVPHDA